ncbi:hypothetical protein pb186bvf_020841 [Paramecium bursaria]
MLREAQNFSDFVMRRVFADIRYLTFFEIKRLVLFKLPSILKNTFDLVFNFQRYYRDFIISCSSTELQITFTKFNHSDVDHRLSSRSYKKKSDGLVSNSLLRQATALT